MARVALWHGRLDVAPAEVERLRALLSMPEQARAERFRFARDRRRFIVRRARLRACLATPTGIDPARLTFALGANGKPRLVEPGPQFSLSHSGEHWLVALAAVDVGADIEAINPAIDCDDTARGLFGPAEIAALGALPDSERRRAFFDVWARKEAFVKAIGQGLSYPLDAFRVSTGTFADLLDGGDGWAMRRIDIAPDVAGAVVARDDGLPLVVAIQGFDRVAAAA